MLTQKVNGPVGPLIPRIYWSCQNFTGSTNFSSKCQLFTKVFFDITSPAGSLLAVKLHSENGVIFKGKYEILISLILQWQDNPRKTMRNQLS